MHTNNIHYKNGDYSLICDDGGRRRSRNWMDINDGGYSLIIDDGSRRRSRSKRINAGQFDFSVL